MTVALLCCATLTHAQTTPEKKELVAKVLLLQQPGIDGMARQLAQQPVMQLMQQANNVLQQQVPADKREAAAKTIEAEAKKFVEEATPIIRERAIKLAPATVGTILEERFNEEELKQLIAWLESPVNKKYQQIGPELQNSMVPKLVAETAPLLDPKLQALQQKMRAALGMPAASAPPRPAASGARPAAKPASK
jgi:hypothetical protein